MCSKRWFQGLRFVGKSLAAALSGSRQLDLATEAAITAG